MGQSMPQGARQGMGAVQQGAQNVAQGAQNMGQNMAQGARQGMGAAQQGAQNMRQGAQNMGQNMAQGARPAMGIAQQGAQNANQGAQSMGQNMPQGARQGMGTAQQGVQNVGQGAQNMAQGAQNMGAQQAPVQNANAPQQVAQNNMQQMQNDGPPKPAEGPGVQVVLRMFQPDMNLLKATAKQLSELPHIKLNLYGQGGEILVVIAAQGRTAPATELAENAAAQMEAAMGDVVYTRGKTPLAEYVCALMNKHELNLTAPDDETGSLLEAEFKAVKSADKVFDFGHDSYHHSKLAGKIADTAIMDDEESSDPVQLASDRSFAAKKCTKSDFGVSISSVPGADTIAVAVTYGKLVYIRSIKEGDDARKKAVLSALDIIRRLINGKEIPYARTFKAAQEIDWNEPVTNAKSKGLESANSKGLIIPIIVLVIVSIALGVGIWYVVQNFIITDESAMPVAVEQTTSQSEQIADSTAPAEGEVAPAEGETTPAEGETAPAEGETTPTEGEGQAEGDTSEVVHPFG